MWEEFRDVTQITKGLHLGLKMCRYSSETVHDGHLLEIKAQKSKFNYIIK